MKRAQRNKEFLKQLFEEVAKIKKMRPKEMHTISINANYGHYEIVIHGDDAKKKMHRPIEILGEIHHLFVSPGQLRTYPSSKQSMANLKDTVIARGLTVHLHDPLGDGKHLEHRSDGNGMDAKEFINLAGEIGEKLIWEARHDDKMSLEAYHIIQQDIIKALKEHKRRALEYIS